MRPNTQIFNELLIDKTTNYNIHLGIPVTFISDYECLVYQNKRIVGSLPANRQTEISLLEGKSKIRFQSEVSHLRNRFDVTIHWNGKDSLIKVKLKNQVFGKGIGSGATKSKADTFRQLNVQKEALQRKMWSMPPRERKKIQIEIDKIEDKINKLKQSINTDKK